METSESKYLKKMVQKNFKKNKVNKNREFLEFITKL